MNTNKILRYSLAFALCFLSQSISALVEAKPIVVVLTFGGDEGEQVRASLIDPLQKRFQIVPGQELLQACEDLGISMSRGANLAKAAAHINAVAIIGGTIKAGFLNLAVYSGKTGQPLITGTVPCSEHLSSKNLGKALNILLKGLNKAPKQVGQASSQSEEPIAPPPSTKTRSTAKGRSEGEITDEDSSDSELKYEPEGINTTGQRDDVSENPLAKDPNASNAASTPAPIQVVSNKDGETTAKAALSLGWSFWGRNFSLNEPIGPGLAYNASTSSLVVQGSVYPGAFFTDSLAKNIFLKLGYQQSLGLKSTKNQSSSTTSESDSLDTSLRQILIDLGYDWKIFKAKPLSPHLDLGIGYGLLDFSINWGDSSVDIPSFAYRFVRINAEIRYPLLDWIGVHLGFDYRLVLNAGEILDDQWYGRSTVGGINGRVGLDGKYKKFIGGIEYNYTRYFYAFTDVNQRIQDNMTRAAGGALDLYHGIMVTIGYTY